MASAIWLMSVQNTTLRLSSIALLSLLLPWAGPQYLPLLFVAWALILVLCGRPYWREAGISLLATLFGGMIFLLVLSIWGRLETFLKFTGSQQRSLALIHDLLKYGKFNHGNYIPKDPSFPFLFGAVLILFFFNRKSNMGESWKVMQFGISFTILFTFVMLAVAKFPTYYSYMVVVPICISLCSGLAYCRSRAA